MESAAFALYLDYDGVLHPPEVYRDKRGRIFILKKDANGEMVRKDSGLFEHCRTLEMLLRPYPEVKIILSTSWVRELKSFKKARARLTPDLKARTIGATFHSYMRHEFSPYAIRSNFDSRERYEQILADVKNRGVERWLAIDDDDYGLPDDLREEHFVVPFTKKGIVEPVVFLELQEKLAKIFG